jgi:hypothetical protein
MMVMPILPMPLLANNEKLGSRSNASGCKSQKRTKSEKADKITGPATLHT